MSQETLKQTISNSKFSPEFKERLISVLPGLEKNTLEGLEREVSRADGLLAQDAITEQWEKFGRLIPALKKDDVAAKAEFFAWMDSVTSLFSQDDKEYFLNLVLDVRVLTYASRIHFTVSEFNRLLDYEILMFRVLPQAEVEFFFRYHFLYLLSKINLYKEVQVTIYDRDLDFEQNFGKIFSDIMLVNKETLGSQKGKPVGEWVQEFISSSPISMLERSIVQIGDFLVKSPSAGKLSGPEKSQLSEILKLFLWFYNPEIDEAELQSYKQEVWDRQAKEIEAEFLRDNPELDSKPLNSNNIPQAKPVTAFSDSPPPSPVMKRPEPPKPSISPKQSINSLSVPQAASVKKPSPAIDGNFKMPSRDNSGGVNIQDMLYQKDNQSSFEPQANTSGRGLNMKTDSPAPKPYSQASPQPVTPPNDFRASVPKPPKPIVEMKPLDSIDPAKAAPSPGLQNQSQQSLSPDKFPVLRPKTLEDQESLNDKLGYSAKNDPIEDIDEKIAKLKQRSAKK